MLTWVGNCICYARANGIIKIFSMCSPVVKATLFRTFCLNMYCSQLWRDFSSCSIRQLIVGYNHLGILRIIIVIVVRVECSSLIIYIVLLNCGATIFMVLCSFPVGCHPLCGALCGGAGSLKPAALSSFFYVIFICIFIFTVRETDIGVYFKYFMYLCLHVS